MRFIPTLFVAGFLALAAAPVGAHDEAGHAHGAQQHGQSGKDDKSGADGTSGNPPAASLGGAISGREEAGKGGNSEKGNTAEGLRPN